MQHRKERDSLGEVLVPEERRWGAQTQRSLENFPIGDEKMPLSVVKTIALIKKAAAEEIITGKHVMQKRVKYLWKTPINSTD